MTKVQPIRIVTAASLFDGHDASINLMRRLLQDAGAEVIHLGHNRSVADVVRAVLQEGAQGLALSSYQGGHMEYFKYAKDLLDLAGANDVRIFGGGGGVIVHDEKAELEKYGIAQIFHPDDGRRLGLDGMIKMIIDQCNYDPLQLARGQSRVRAGSSIQNQVRELEDVEGQIPSRALGLAVSALELGQSIPENLTQQLKSFSAKRAPVVIGVTGTGGAGKSSLVDELVSRFLNAIPDVRIGVVCVDPTKKKTGGALLGDRIRMNSLSRPGVFMRSMASRDSDNEISKALPKVLDFMKTCAFDVIIAETSGIGQSQGNIRNFADLTLYVMTSEFGAQSQLEKIEMIDFADFIAINKADRRGSLDALRDVRKQYRRSHKIFEAPGTGDEALPVYLTQAAQFNDSGCNELFFGLINKISQIRPEASSLWKAASEYRKSIPRSERTQIVPPERQSYLAEIVAAIHKYKNETESKAVLASQLGSALMLAGHQKEAASHLLEFAQNLTSKLDPRDLKSLETWDDEQKCYRADELVYRVRDKEIRQKLVKTSLSGTKIRRVALPRLTDWGDRLRYLRLENRPGEFPYTAGVFPLKRENEDPTRMFAGEGPPERTNRRFHYLAKGQPATRLSTAFDSVTLYGEDPNQRPDIFGKVGESGVSVATLDDMKRLFDGFDLCAPTTSVSMTINGPAPMILAFFMNTAIDQQLEKKQKELGRVLTATEVQAVTEWTFSNVRGTVQADILKEDQGQNTCIFSIDFALRMMGDIQDFFIRKKVRNFYSVSISGYHIAEAGANPISQLAFTLSNAFTFVEYYRARGMAIDDFAPNLSFFFSNGLDPEYSVLGRVARRIWAVAMRDLYGANDRSQKLKYHIQTSGRSLHAQEIDFNDIRTTLQALLAVYDNCNSLHTNAYDEAITTPTEESVRRAMAIQMIINKEFGPAVNENPIQGSYFFEELTDLVEEAVLAEFLRLSERGGVLGAMETQYQRGKIQEESMLYEHLKHSGELPIVGVNTYINPATLAEGYQPPRIEMARASYEEKTLQLKRVQEYQKTHTLAGKTALNELKQAAVSGGNIFEALLKTSKFCSLAEITRSLYEVGGQYRRNI